MANRAHVPKFGNWSEDNVPYTVYFDKARKGRSDGKMINPNDPRENPSMFGSPAPPTQAPAARNRSDLEGSKGRGSGRPNDRVGREEGDFKQNAAEAPARNDYVTGRKIGNESAHQRHGGRGSNTNRPMRQSVGSDPSIERSPLHPDQHARIVGKGNGSPSWDGKDLKNSYESHGAPGRSKLRPVSRGDETPDRGAAVPRFGEWNDSDPSAAENFTDIFNRVRDEKHGVPPKSPGNQSSYPQTPRRENSKNCCLPWCRK